MMKITYYFAFFQLLVISTAATTKAQIPMVPSLSDIASAQKIHLFVETTALRNASKEAAPDDGRLKKLATSLGKKMASPEIAAALKAALPDAEIKMTGDSEVQILDKRLSEQERAVFDSSVKVKSYTGELGALLSSLSTKDFAIVLNQTFTLPLSRPISLSKLNPSLKDFTYSGNLRGLLSAVGRMNGTGGGYYALFDKEKSLTIYLIAQVD